MSHITLRILQLKAFSAEGQSWGRFSLSYILMIYITFLKKYFPFYLQMILIYLFKVTTYHKLIHDLQTELNTLVDWLNINKLTINLK